MAEPEKKLKLCGCPIPDTTCDCSKVRSCGCSKELEKPCANGGNAPKELGVMPASLLASNRRKQTDTFLSVSYKGKPCGYYRITPYNLFGPKFRIRRKLGGGFSITSEIDDSGPADGNYTIISPTEPLPGKYVVEKQYNGAYVIQNTAQGPPLTRLEEGNYTFIPVYVVPTKPPEGDDSPKISSQDVNKHPDLNNDKGLKTSKDSKQSKGSKGSQESEGSKSSKQEEEIINKENIAEEQKQEDMTAENKAEMLVESKVTQEVVDIQPDIQPGQSQKTDNEANNTSITLEPRLSIEQEEPLKPTAYFVQHTALPGLYRFNYCDTRPNMGPRPVIDGIYPLWDRDASGNSVPSNRSDGIYTLEWVELESEIDENNMHLPQPVAERIISVVSEVKPDGTNVTTVTRKTAPVKEIAALNCIYPGGLPPGLQAKNPPDYGVAICGCSIPETDYAKLNPDDCLCLPSPKNRTEITKTTKVNESNCICKKEVSGSLPESSVESEYESACLCAKLEEAEKKREAAKQILECSKNPEPKPEGCIDCNCKTENEIEKLKERTHDSTWKELEEYTGSDNFSDQANDDVCVCTNSNEENKRKLKQEIASCSRAQNDSQMFDTYNSTTYHQIAPFVHKSNNQTFENQQFEDGLSCSGATSTPMKSQNKFNNQANMPDWRSHPPRSIDENTKPPVFKPTEASGSNSKWMEIPPEHRRIRNPIQMEMHDSTKHVQTIKPKQVIQVQPGINIVRRDDNEDVDVLVEMEVDADFNVDGKNSKFTSPGHVGNERTH